MLNYALHKKNDGDEKHLTMKLSFCYTKHMLESNIFLCKLVLGARRGGKGWRRSAKNIVELNEWLKHDTGLVMQLSSAKWGWERDARRTNEINFNDIKSPETPSAEMNYATHQKRGKSEEKKCTAASIMMMPFFAAARCDIRFPSLFFLQPNMFLIRFVFRCVAGCLQLKESPTSAVTSDSIFFNNLMSERGRKKALIKTVP